MDDTYNILRYFELRKGISVVLFFFLVCFIFFPFNVAFSSRFLLPYLCVLFVLLYIRTHVYMHTSIITRVFYTFCWYFVSYFQEIVDQFCVVTKNTYPEFNEFFFRRYKLWNEYMLSSAVMNMLRGATKYILIITRTCGHYHI